MKYKNYWTEKRSIPRLSPKRSTPEPVNIPRKSFEKTYFSETDFESDLDDEMSQGNIRKFKVKIKIFLQKAFNTYFH